MDPLAPCVMYWPDNEPLPEQGQIRPIDSAVMSYPPIINTGNKGAAEKQPGDWVCSKCNYLNWRRRKMAIDAEGNGDSISAAVQAERIALLTSLLSTQHDSPQQHDGQAPAIPSGLPGHATMDQAPPFTVFETVPRSQAPLYAQDKDAYPIYQTSGHRASASLASYTVPLLPSFLQDIVQEPSLSPRRPRRPRSSRSRSRTTLLSMTLVRWRTIRSCPSRAPGELEHVFLPPPRREHLEDGRRGEQDACDPHHPHHRCLQRISGRCAGQESKVLGSLVKWANIWNGAPVFFFFLFLIAHEANACAVQEEKRT
ncbi:hypothetical protein A0H81_05414 [Grifola frondosa]|uniref:Uncharacterized protein n=1 Tax=Grifola frondosa TaxID=5627 RepID=A0A1C7MDI6_GRIFR|nr:hypothetical protein A0H81_05414 [Grifola frondosa]